MSRDVWTFERLFFLASISYFLVDIKERINVVFLEFSGPSCLVADTNLLTIMFSRQKLEPLQISFNSVGMILYPTAFLPDKYGKRLNPTASSTITISFTTQCTNIKYGDYWFRDKRGSTVSGNT